MQAVSLDDIKKLIELNKPLNVIKKFVYLYCEWNAYQEWLKQKKEEYDLAYPKVDDTETVIEYSNNPEDDNYKPTFEEWLNTNEYGFTETVFNISAELKEILKSYGKLLMNKELANGFNSSLGFKINCKRTDLDNMKNLLEYMKSTNTDTVDFRVYDNSFEKINQEQLQTMINELIGYGLQLYQKKWVFENNVANITTTNDLENLQW